MKRLSVHGKKSYDWTREKLGHAKVYYKSNIAPHAQKMLAKTKDFSREKLSYSKDKIAKTLKSLPQKEVNQLKRENDQASPNVKYYYGTKEKISSFGKKAGDVCKRIFAWISGFLRSAFSQKNRSKTFAIIAAVLLIIFIANISYLQKLNASKETDTQIEQSLSDLEIKKDDAALAVITGDNAKATTLLDEISTSLKAYENNKTFKDRLDALKNDIQKLYDKISGVNRLTDNSQIANFSSDGRSFYLFGNIAVALTSGKTIFSASIDPAGNPEEAARIPSDGGNIVASCLKDTSILINTSSKSIYKYENKKLTKVDNTSGSWPQSVAIHTYGDNIYLLDPIAGQIYRSTPDGNNYSATSDYIKDSTVDIKGSVDFAIDGYVYVLRSDGNVIKLAQGIGDNFSLKNIPGNSTITKPKKIKTTDEINSLYILDDNRILEFDKDGKYINQFNFDKSMDNITDFQINPKTKELYIINSGKIYKYSI